MHFRVSSIAVPLLAAAAVAFGSVATASAQPVSCGQVVTHDVTLDADLDCSQPGSTGLVVGADGITIDLNGHTITGTTQGVGTATIGIDNRGGHDGVTVRNGKILQTNAAVWLSGASDNRLVGLNVTGVTGSAVMVEGGQGNVIRGSQLFSRGTPITVSGSNLMRIVGNGLSSVFGSAIFVEANGARIARNTSGGSIFVAGDLNRIARNVVSGALDSGIRLRSGAGNVIARNWAVHTVPVVDGDGIHVDAATTGTRIRGNVAANNGDDGIDVESPATTLIGNVANNNHDLGIEAVTGVVDGGGNTASGNGNPLAQCLHVVCG